ncbi:hypothetical protein SAMN05428949_0234 [Chitinophaga sp. YR627]|nr:hypothetical protein SAMN05428949_0234 [Chitinophaga sp. YR627]
MNKPAAVGRPAAVSFYLLLELKDPEISTKSATA